MRRVTGQRRESIRPTRRRAGGSSRGFTLIELIGVLAIMTLIAGVLTPSLAQRVSRTKAAEEKTEIAAIGDALLQYATIYQSIPGSGTWAAKAASMLGLSTAQVLYSIPEDTSTARVYLIHPSFQPLTGSGAIGDPIWTQTGAGATQITNARVLILSMHRAGLTLPVSSGAAASVTAFDNIWN